MIFSRHWSMPSADTFDCEPIEGFVKKYLMKSKVSVDPFARNKRWTTYTNDLNPKTRAEFHMQAGDFLEMLQVKKVLADLVILDPPYSLEQLKRSYESIGIEYGYTDGWKPGRWSEEKKLVEQITTHGSVVLSFGWNSVGMGKAWTCLETMLVCHGPGHNDTICIAEQKNPVLQINLFHPPLPGQVSKE